MTDSRISTPTVLYVTERAQSIAVEAVENLGGGQHLGQVVGAGDGPRAPSVPYPDAPPNCNQHEIDADLAFDEEHLRPGMMLPPEGRRARGEPSVPGAWNPPPSGGGK